MAKSLSLVDPQSKYTASLRRRADFTAASFPPAWAHVTAPWEGQPVTVTSRGLVGVLRLILMHI